MSEERQQLLDVAAQLGIEHHPQLGIKKLRALIDQHQMNTFEEQKVQATADPAWLEYERKRSRQHNNTPDMVREAIKAHAAKDGFVAQFPDDGTWVFKCRGAEDSGNLNIPLNVIVMKAETVSRGARRPLAIAKTPNDPTYAGTVLSA